MKLIHFDYANKTVTISKNVGNLICLEIISWDQMKLRTLEQLKGAK